MEDIKKSTSSVKSTLEKFEEPITTYGQPVRMERIWRDSNLLPENAPDLEDVSYLPADGYKVAHVKRFTDGATVRNLIDHYVGLPLERIKGTKNCFSNNLLKDIITEDSTNKSYLPSIFVDGVKLAYGVGNPVFDVAAGTLLFCDEEYSDRIKDSNISVTFYRYVGRKGASVGEAFDNPDLPFRDNIPHFKNSENDNNVATFKVRGANKPTSYILPPEDGKWFDKGDEDGGVVVLQENLEDVLWEQSTRISGGEWMDIDHSTRVFRFNRPSDEGTGEDGAKNNP